MLKGLSQDGIAKKLGLTQQSVSKLESKEKIDQDRFLQILKAIGCTGNDLEDISQFINTAIITPPPIAINHLSIFFNKKVAGKVSFVSPVSTQAITRPISKI